jgi:hypothetical protein
MKLLPRPYKYKKVFFKLEKQPQGTFTKAMTTPAGYVKASYINKNNRLYFNMLPQKCINYYFMFLS